MTSSPHIINRVSVEINTGNLGDVSRLQEDVSQQLWQQAFPQMEQLFDRLVPADQVVRLDQITLDLPRLDPQHAIDDFVPQLIAALERSLSDYLAGYRPTEVAASREQHPRAAADWEILLYFLQYGRLPWWSSQSRVESWLARWQTALQTDATWQKPLRLLLNSQPKTIHRLVEQLPENIKHQLILQLQPTWTAWRSLLEHAQQLMAAASLSARDRTALHRQAWITIFTLLSQTSTEYSLPKELWLRQWLPRWMDALRAHLPLQTLTDRPTEEESPRPQGQSSQERWLEAATGSEASARRASSQSLQYQTLSNLIASVVQGEQSLWQSALAQVWQGRSPTARLSSTPALDFSLPASSMEEGHPQSAPETSLDAEPNQQSPNTNKEEDTQPADEVWTREQRIEQSLPEQAQTEVERVDLTHNLPDETSDLSAEELEAGLYLNQAGLVLLHPFLRNYFEDVGLLAGNQFQDADCQQTAVYLLHYLATRQTTSPEYELVLPKLLCGWPLNVPIMPSDLPRSALDEAEHLLQTVINYWEALKSTSPDGLREGFFQREGKLTQTGEGAWKLKVEQQTIDILLSRLPWGLNMVKLPWMDELLVVEWI